MGPFKEPIQILLVFGLGYSLRLVFPGWEWAIAILTAFIYLQGAGLFVFDLVREVPYPEETLAVAEGNLEQKAGNYSGVIFRYLRYFCLNTAFLCGLLIGIWEV